MSKSDALQHLSVAIDALRLEAYRGDSLSAMSRVQHFTIAEELKRIDAAIGRKGASIFATLAHDIETAYVEIVAARLALEEERA